MQNSDPMIPQNWARRFFTIWTGQAFSLFGSALVQFALIWWLTQRSGSATVLAIATLVGMLPQILIGPFAGALVDRLNRRVIMILADALIAAATLVLVYLFASDKVQIWHVYAILAVRSVGTAFHFPAMSASIHTIDGAGRATDARQRPQPDTAGNQWFDCTSSRRIAHWHLAYSGDPVD